MAVSATMARATIRFQAQDSELFRSMSRIHRGFGTMKSSYLKFAAATASVALFGKVIKDAVTFEAELYNVRKTTGATIEEVNRMGDTFKDLSVKTGIAKKELAEISVVAGRLGIFTKAGKGEQGIKALEKFTELIAKSRVAMPEMAGSSEEAATKVAKLLNVLNLGVDDTERLLSAFNELSNNTAAGADDISEFTRRIGATGVVMGGTAAQVAALGASLTEVGSTAELGSTAINRFFIDASKDMDKFVNKLGPAGQKFKEAFERSPVLGLQVFLEELNKKGDGATTFLKELNLSGVRVIQTMLQLSGDKGLQSLTNTLELSGKGFMKGTSIQQEFERQLESTQSGVKILGAALSFISDSFAKQFLPMIRKFSLEMSKIFTSTDFVRSVEALGKTIAFLGKIMLGTIKIAVDFRHVLFGVAVVIGINKVAAALGGLRLVIAALAGDMKALTVLAASRSMFSGVALTSIMSDTGRIKAAIAASKAAGAGSSAAIVGTAINQRMAAMGVEISKAGNLVDKTTGKFVTMNSAILASNTAAVGLGASLKGAALAAKGMVSALLVNPMTWVAAAVISLALVVRHVKNLNAQMERLRNFREDFSNLSEFGGAGSDVLNSMDRTSDMAGEIGAERGGVGRALKGKDPLFNLPFAREDLKLLAEEARKSKESLIQLAESTGQSGEKIREEIKNMSVGSQEYGQVVSEVSSKGRETMGNFVDQYIEVAKQVKTANENMSETSDEFLELVRKGFLKLPKVTEKAASETIFQVARMEAAAGDIGKAITILMSEGMTSTEAISKLRDAGQVITDEWFISNAANAIRYEDAGRLATSLLALGMISESDAAAAASGALTSSALLEIAKAKPWFGAAGKEHGAEYAKNVGGAVTGVWAAMGIEDQLKDNQFAKMLEELEKSIEDIGGGGGTSKESEAQKELQRQIDETTKKIEEYRKEYVSSQEKILEDKKKLNTITEKELLLLGRIKRAAGDTFEGWKLEELAKDLEKMNENLEKLNDSFRESTQVVDDVLQSFRDMKEEFLNDIDDINDEIAQIEKDHVDELVQIRMDADKRLKEEAPEGGFSPEDQKQRDQDMKTVEETNKMIETANNISNVPDRSKELKLLEEQLTSLGIQRTELDAISDKSAKQIAKLHEMNRKYLSIEASIKRIKESEARRTGTTPQSAFAKGYEDKQFLEGLSPTERAEEEKRRAVEEEEFKRNIAQAGVDDVNNYIAAQQAVTLARRFNDEEGNMKNKIDREKEIALAEENLKRVISEGAQRQFLEDNDERLTEEQRRTIEASITAMEEDRKKQSAAIENLRNLDTQFQVTHDNMETRGQQFQEAETTRMQKIGEAIDALILKYQALAAAQAGGGGGAQQPTGDVPSNSEGGWARVANIFKSFAGGGYTGSGGKFQPAGIVHKDEYIIPKWMNRGMPGVISWLESIRKSGSVPSFSSGGLAGAVSSSVHKSNDIKINMTNTIKESIDMRSLAEYLGYSLSNRLLS